MFDAQDYLNRMKDKLLISFGKRLVYIGLQGSYMRGEATEQSDIDPMVVIDQLSAEDLGTYRQAVEELGCAEKSCGFLCGKEQLQNWNALEIGHLLQSTKDFYGNLASLVPAYDRRDVRNYLLLSLNNLSHEMCHRRIHADRNKNTSGLPGCYKSAFFILQDLYWMNTGSFIQKASELAELMEVADRKVLERYLDFRSGAECNFEKDFSLIFEWCQRKIIEI